VDDESRREVNGLKKTVQAVIDRQAKIELGAIAAKQLEQLTKVLTAAYDKAIAYTDLILVAGYASFFALWSATKPVLSERLAIAACLSMLISAATFVFFEVYKAIHTSRFMTRNQQLLVEPDPRKLQANLKAYEQNEGKQALQFVRVWAVVLAISIPTAVLAVLLLGYCFVLQIVWPQTPISDQRDLREETPALRGKRRIAFSWTGRGVPAPRR
jgi:hypothetical protein